jgi:hypothetical protein
LEASVDGNGETRRHPASQSGHRMIIIESNEWLVGFDFIIGVDLEWNVLVAVHPSSQLLNDRVMECMLEGSGFHTATLEHQGTIRFSVNNANSSGGI